MQCEYFTVQFSRISGIDLKELDEGVLRRLEAHVPHFYTPNLVIGSIAHQP